MAPEILADDLDTSIFSNYCRADIYSMALVYWEIIQRTRLGAGYTPPAYQQPYEAYVQSDPSIEEMKIIVVDRKCRPKFEAQIEKIPIMKKLIMVTEECWMGVANARLPALRIKKSIGSISV